MLALPRGQRALAGDRAARAGGRARRADDAAEAQARQARGAARRGGRPTSRGVRRSSPSCSRSRRGGRYPPLDLTPAAAEGADLRGPAARSSRASPRAGRCWSSSRTRTGSTRPRSSCSTSWSTASQRLPVLLVVTFRPEFRPPWTGQRARDRAHARAGSSRRQAAAMVERVDRRQGAAGRGARGRSSPGPTACRCSSRS